MEGIIYGYDPAMYEGLGGDDSLADENTEGASHNAATAETTEARRKRKEEKRAKKALKAEKKLQEARKRAQQDLQGLAGRASVDQDRGRTKNVDSGAAGEGQVDPEILEHVIRQAQNASAESSTKKRKKHSDVHEDNTAEGSSSKKKKDKNHNNHKKHRTEKKDQTGASIALNESVMDGTARVDDLPKSTHANGESSGSANPQTPARHRRLSVEVPILRRPANPALEKASIDPAAKAQVSAKSNTKKSGGSASSSGPSRASSSKSPSTTLNAYALTRKAVNRSPKQPEYTDEQLRNMLNTPKAMNEYIASRWLLPKELQRLQAAGILEYKQGRFSAEENLDMKKAVADFRTAHRLNEDDMVELLMQRDRSKPAKHQYPNFWPEFAAKLPGRPLKSVKDYLQREYDPRGKKGAWTKEEDADLWQAVEMYSTGWKKVAEVVGRSEMACRDRWREQRNRQQRNEGTWTPGEEDKLIKIIVATNTRLGMDPHGSEAPWSVIEEEMNNTRNRTQCRKKWQGELRARVLGEGKIAKLSKGGLLDLVEAVQAQNVENETSINWNSLVTGRFAGSSASRLAAAWSRLKTRAKIAAEISFPDLLEALHNTVKADLEKTVSKPRSAPVSHPQTPIQPASKPASQSGSSLHHYKSKEFVDSDMDDEDEAEAESAM